MKTTEELLKAFILHKNNSYFSDQFHQIYEWEIRANNDIRIKFTTHDEEYSDTVDYDLLDYITFVTQFKEEQ